MRRRDAVRRSTYTFALEWVQEVPAHFAVISRRSWRVVHAPHVIRGALEEERTTTTTTKGNVETASYKQHRLSVESK